MAAVRTALFLDLGGTLLRIEDDEIVAGPDGGAEILPNVVEVLAGIATRPILVVTNQSGIGRGTLDHQAVRAYVRQVDAALGGRIDDYWACPHPDSTYRKPAPGMLLALADKHFVDLAASTYVGDSESDRQCAMAAGVGRFVWAWEFFGWPAPGVGAAG